MVGWIGHDRQSHTMRTCVGISIACKTESRGENMGLNLAVNGFLLRRRQIFAGWEA